MCTLDLKDAYFLVPVHKKHRIYLRFRFKGTLYQFTCLPFGLSCCPLIFTKIMKPVIRYLRSRGWSSVLYIDDFLMIEDSYTNCKENIRVTTEFLEWLGFIINFEKSVLEPALSCKYLGLIIDTKEFVVRLPEEKSKNIRASIIKLSNKKVFPILDFAKLIGMLIATCPAVEYGELYTKNLERAKIQALLRSEGSFESKMYLADSAKSDLQWWLSNLGRTKSIKTTSFSKTIYTDASGTGWGGTDNVRETHGFWNEEQKLWHINYRELLAIKLILPDLASDCSNCQILLRVDNTTAISYINKKGGVKYPHFHALAKEIWQWAEKRGIWLYATYIQSSKNIRADQLSRINPDIEWSLNQAVFEEIVRSLGQPEIDFFASAWNAKCNAFVSWFPEPAAVEVDAFTFSWASLKFYAFPPFALILKTLSKIIEDRAEGILIVPSWNNQPWFPLFKKMVVGNEIYCGPSADLLLSVDRLYKHPHSDRLTLIAANVSGKVFSSREPQH